MAVERATHIAMALAAEESVRFDSLAFCCGGARWVSYGSFDLGEYIPSLPWLCPVTNSTIALDCTSNLVTRCIQEMLNSKESAFFNVVPFEPSHFDPSNAVSLP
jgi:hypothetical protein